MDWIEEMTSAYFYWKKKLKDRCVEAPKAIASAPPLVAGITFL